MSGISAVAADLAADTTTDEATAGDLTQEITSLEGPGQLIGSHYFSVLFSIACIGCYYVGGGRSTIVWVPLGT